jgi:hypothetical protein
MTDYSIFGLEPPLALEASVFEYLTLNSGTYVVRVGQTMVTIRHPGMSEKTIQWHCIACLITLGIWTPVFAWLVFQKMPRDVVLWIGPNGKVKVTE